MYGNLLIATKKHSRRQTVASGWVLLISIVILSACDEGTLPTEFEEGRARLSGTVRVEGTQVPLRGAAVSVGNHLDRTGEDGRFLLEDLALGSRTIQVELEGFRTHVEPIELGESEQVTDIQLSPVSETVIFAGLVTDARQIPIEGARVEIDQGQQNHTSASGAFKFDRLPRGMVKLSVHHEGFEAYQIQLPVFQDALDHEVHLAAALIEPPSGLHAVRNKADRPGAFNRVELTWDAVSDPSAAGYAVYRSREGNAFENIATLPGTATTYVDEELTSGRHLYTVASVNVDGREGPTAEPVSVYPFSIDLVRIPKGAFEMGTSGEGGDADERPRHPVTISRAFLLGRYEVTQQQWEAVMGSNPSRFVGCATCPVEQVSWEESQEFVRKLNDLAGTDSYRLPSEAEWEYAARAGTTTRRFFGDDENGLGEYAWFKSNSGKATHPVGGKKPNPWGLYDTYGNVFEWVEDWYDGAYYQRSPQVDPQGPASGALHTPRGASWNCASEIVRSAFRGNHGLGSSSYLIGFRLAATE